RSRAAARLTRQHPSVAREDRGLMVHDVPCAPSGRPFDVESWLNCEWQMVVMADPKCVCSPLPSCALSYGSYDAQRLLGTIRIDPWLASSLTDVTRRLSGSSCLEILNSVVPCWSPV